MSNFRQFDGATGFLLPPSLDEWLPERHLARFVVEVIDGLDLSAMVKSYRARGSAGYHPALLLGLFAHYAGRKERPPRCSRSHTRSNIFRSESAGEIPDTHRPMMCALSGST
jgi:hypothetical protein